MPMQKTIDLTQAPLRPKFATSLEKKIEHLWLESEQRGWVFNDFAVVVMEVLTILHHRNTFLAQDAEPSTEKEAKSA